MKDLFGRRVAMKLGGLAVLFTGLVAPSAMADTVAPTMSTASCSAPAFSQPFASLRDNNYYTLAPGQSVDNFDGNGWALSGGASITTSQLADGQSGSVLNLPSGSQAVSPPICVTSDYPSARTQVRDVVGGEGVQFYVSYDATKSWVKPQSTGQFHSEKDQWSLSNQINLQPPNSPGWQIVRFTLIPGGKTSDFQVYNFWIDPRMHR
jgi:hypothetical protein